MTAALPAAAQLRRLITDHFSREELWNLCHDLGIDHENLAGTTKEGQVRELVRYCEGHGLWGALVAACQRERPFLAWSSAHGQQTERDEPQTEAAFRHYLRYLRDRYSYLELQGLGVGNQTPARLSLLDLYVPLWARGDLPDGETWARDEAGLLDEQQQVGEPQPLLDLLQDHDGLIVLGDPGSGKTTFLKYLALQLAHGEGEKLGLVNWLPIVLPLSAYAQALAERDVPLSDFFITYYQQRGIDLPLPRMLTDSLMQGGVLFLLDGLDEVQDVDLRYLLVQRVLDFFTFQRQRGNKFVLTSRLVGYRAVRQVVAGLMECTLVDLGETAVLGFIDRWAERVGGVDGAALKTAVLQNGTMRQLASNPLLLTILLLMQQAGMGVPSERVRLYEQYVQTLLTHWTRARGLDRPAGQRFDPFTLNQLLLRLAYWMQMSSLGIGLVRRLPLLRQLRQLCADLSLPAQAADHFLADVQQQAGLLVERGAGEYGFIHRTFQEYLTAVFLAQLPVEQLAEQLQTHLLAADWHEIVLLTLAYVGLLEGREQDVAALLQQFLATGGAAVVLAGQSLLDLGAVADGMKTAVVAELETTLSDAAGHSASVRVAAGQVLGQVGDPRTAVMELDALPFCYVPNGRFWLGAGRAAHLQELPSFWLAKYPLSQAQFAAFVAAGGYSEARFWGEAAEVERWRLGETQDWQQRGWRKRPFAYDEPFNLPNHPVVGISWYEALAFTRWLSEQAQVNGWLPSGWQIVLPSEAEWEKGARGGLLRPSAPLVRPLSQMGAAEPTVPLVENELPKRPFPWRKGEVAALANGETADVAVSNSLGCFAAGASVYGCEELSGNVWEWTRSLYASYPYDGEDGREKTAVKLYDNMVLRGGAFWTAEKYLRCTARVRRSPHDRSSSYGFRLAIVRVC